MQPVPPPATSKSRSLVMDYQAAKLVMQKILLLSDKAKNAAEVS